ncbi:MAG: AmmeMemoRadiSam system protein B [Deltaproteobacteria bacterium]|nr:AmmeMemoRadiSam system protein B [Deltaproteobacteria bacterium]
MMRTSPIAGSWYPGDRAVLTSMVEEMIAKVGEPAVSGRLFGVISPHAGIQFSGEAAAHGFKLLRDTGAERIILLGPSHHSHFSGVATSGVSGYETPLGTVPVDRDVSESLARLPSFQGPRDAELQEHSLEMQLPFLQTVLDEFSIVPLVVGELAAEEFAAVAQELRQYCDESTVVVASSDFTHYGNRFGYVPFCEDVKEGLSKLDGGAIERILDKDFSGFQSYLKKTGATICGARPIGVLLQLLPSSARGTLLSYYTSGDLLQDYTDVVSYASIAFTL